ncbi:MAG: aminoglycoside phosphotransferase family protein, partial [Actinobacteria bacterium]|nr:aminoglycoside phosphotransferase family protein [Actinomycetota bacterium]
MRIWVQQDFGVEIITLTAVEHGADEASLLWRGVGAGGASYLVKLSGGGTPAGLFVSVHLAEHGVAGVMRPLIGRHGRPWSDRGRRRLSVVPWVSETRALEGEMSPAHWRSYGALLAKVHATAVTDALATSLPREDHTHYHWASVARTLDSSLRLTAEDPAAGGTVDDLVRALAQEWCAAGDRVSTLLDQADSLALDLHTGESTSVVCHGDPHLGNLLIGQDERVWLIDWDDAVLAPRERDLMFILGGVLAFAPVTRQQQSWFFEGYGSTDIDPIRLAYYRCARALEDLAYPAAQIVDVHRFTDRERSDA